LPNSKGMKRVGVVQNPNNPVVTVVLRETEDAVRKLNMQVQVVDAQTSDEFDRAFAQLSAGSVDGVVVIPDQTVIEHSRRIAELAQSARLPTAFQRRENVDAGGLFSYGVDINNEFRQGAFYVDRILKGEKPAELPVQQPTSWPAEDAICAGEVGRAAGPADAASHARSSVAATDPGDQCAAGAFG
jgi:putative tryptophan/tyrosine transport system substrate-binding protein